ncbi:Outer membrane protein beta-barrel family protein [Flexibacter flexilis DSM 6793]|uniref:Outer membrane protein beta-barrel family protein n=1 Tax=Flexibacter flexilis DSM 6793 TaxID=927664 RepID=A0A1I1IMY7_9BACT|nr:TonB-dependent receptor [Flexibacter flexilis]SFC37604.1 Outer membrane protein beta-barrel family protein [Flexibacter flexilis DSM 6793]
MQKLLLSFLFGLAAFLAQAQNPTRIRIQGTVQDTTGEKLPAATVMLLQPQDSSLVSYAVTNTNGAFEFKNVKNNPYLLKISYVGYLPYQRRIAASATDINDIGTLKIKPITKELLEVVIQTAKAPLSIKGDTIEYDASSFKVPTGSTVEDLLRRLPGIEVDVDGNVKAQGKDIKRVTVDGKTFFGGDPKSATKNLGAETLSKVQVFNDKSEQAKLTGIDDGKREKVMNLALKDEFKKGAFGKITAAAGTEDRWATRGNYNRFNQKEQFSVIGYANNINETGVNWEDYGEFKGNNSFNDFDNGDFGFSSGGNFYYMTSDVVNNFDGRGFTKNAGVGVNYNYSHEKTKFNTSYFYNQTRLNLDQYSYKQTFLQNSSFYNLDTTAQNNFRGNHSINMRLEQNLDSNNTLITKATARFSGSDNTNKQYQRYLNNDKIAENTLNIDNGSDLSSYTVSGTAIYRHKFKKKGRSFAASAAANISSSDETQNLSSITKYLTSTDPNAQIRAIRQLNDNNNDQTQLKSSLLYLEPLSKKFYWETFYNFSSDHRKVYRDAFNRLQSDERMDSLSTYYTNQIYYNRVGSSVRYSNSGVNVSVGAAGLRYDLEGSYAPSASLPSSHINRNFTAFSPNIDASIETDNNMYLSTSYSFNVKAPQLNDLQPIVNNSNPYYVTTGNPDLLPERSHNFNFSINKFDPSTFSYLNFWIDYTSYLSRVVYNQTIDPDFVTYTRPENISGGYSLAPSLYAGIPIVKTKLKFNMNAGYELGETPTFINSARNNTTSNNYNGGLGFSFTPTDKLILDLGGNLTYNTIDYSIQKSQNQKIWNRSARTTLKWNFYKKFFFEGNFNYNSYENNRLDFKQNIPIINASLRKLFLKDNKLEVRLAAFDLLNKRKSIYQNGMQNTITQQTALTLARYFMLSVSYNLRGYSDKLEKRGH